MDARQIKGAQIAQAGRLAQRGAHLWLVPSESSKGTWVVDYSQFGVPTCTCPDFEERRAFCKHIYAVESHRGRLVVDVTQEATTKKKYTQDWPNYNAAQCNERTHFMLLLKALCDGIENPKQQGRGRPRTPLSDAVYTMVVKVYSGMSGRRATSDVVRCMEDGHLSKAPHYNTTTDYMGDRALTPLLRKLVQESAAPLAGVERDFAVDATGFGTQVYDRWFEEKWGTKKERKYVKLHAICGTRTNVITDAIVSSAGDATKFTELVESTGRRFLVEAVSADKAYSSKENIATVVQMDAVPYIPFRDGTTGRGNEIWRQAFYYFMYKRDDFDAHYHRRSNIETAFSMCKAKFGSSVRAKTATAQANEVLCKVLAHNIVVLVSAIYELKLQPAFWKETA